MAHRLPSPCFGVHVEIHVTHFYTDVHVALRQKAAVALYILSMTIGRRLVNVFRADPTSWGREGVEEGIYGMCIAAIYPEYFLHGIKTFFVRMHNRPWTGQGV